MCAYNGWRVVSITTLAPGRLENLMNQNTATVRPSTANAEQAARDVLNRYVQDGTLTRPQANIVLQFALPFVPKVLANKRRDGWSIEEITEHFQGKLAEAKATGRATSIAATEVYVAMWEGLQTDYAAYVNALKAAQAIEG